MKKLLLIIIELAFICEIITAAQFSGCEITPSGTIGEDDSVQLRCNMVMAPDSQVTACVWYHREPMNTNGPYDIECSGGPEQVGQSCMDDPRITFQSTSDSCGIIIANSQPEDAGVWSLDGIATGNGLKDSHVSYYKLYITHLNS